MQKALFAAMALGMLSACASAPPTIALDSTQLSAFHGRSVVGVTQAPPPLTPMRASSAAFGMLGGLAMASAAQSYAREHHVVDPATAIEDSLNATLVRDHQMIQGERLDVSAVTEEMDYPVRPEALYVDMKTYYWTQAYFAGNWGRFQLFYNALLQVIDGANGEPIAQYNCQKKSHESADNAPTLEELEANDSALMNQLLLEMANACRTEFETNVLGWTAASAPSPASQAELTPASAPAPEAAPAQESALAPEAAAAPAAPEAAAAPAATPEPDTASAHTP